MTRSDAKRRGAARHGMATAYGATPRSRSLRLGGLLAGCPRARGRGGGQTEPRYTRDAYQTVTIAMLERLVTLGKSSDDRNTRPATVVVAETTARHRGVQRFF